MTKSTKIYCHIKLHRLHNFPKMDPCNKSTKIYCCIELASYVTINIRFISYISLVVAFYYH